MLDFLPEPSYTDTVYIGYDDKESAIALLIANKDGYYSAYVFDPANGFAQYTDANMYSYDV